jgi:hypothetical protein
MPTNYTKHRNENDQNRQELKLLVECQHILFDFLPRSDMLSCRDLPDGPGPQHVLGCVAAFFGMRAQRSTQWILTLRSAT